MSESKKAKVKNQHASLCKLIGYQFNDPSILTTALTHKSGVNKKEASNTHGPHNERLEFLGDAVLSLVTANYLYRHNGFMNEGELSRLRAQFVCQENLSLGGKNLTLGNFIMSDKAMRASGSTNTKAILSDAVEALIGAVFIDGGLSAAENVIFKILGFPSAKLLDVEKDAKTKLQEMVQATTQSAPRYVVLESSGPAHAPTFLVGVKIKDEIIATATGENKKVATQSAAIIALERLTQEKSDVV